MTGPVRKPVHLRPDRALSEAEAVDLAGFLRVLAEPSRLQMLALMGARPGTFVNELTEELPISQATTCHHARVLRESGLVDARPVGATMALTVDLDVMFDVATAVRRLARG